jgi:hypothetical protein
MSAIVDATEPAAQPVPLKTGVLSKRSRGRSMFDLVQWQDRKISVFADKIAYALPNGTPKDTIPLLPTSVCEFSEVDKKPFAMKFTTGKEELYLNCVSKLERDEWMTAIMCAIDPALNAESQKRRSSTYFQ